MSTSLTVRDIDPADKSGLNHEARHVGCLWKISCGA